MPRLARLIIPEVALHIVQRGHDRQPCFRDDTDRMVYLALLRDCLTKSRCALHAYCLMTNHVHLLLTPLAADSCAVLMRRLGQRYVQYFNGRYQRSGTLWEGRFRSCLVESAHYVLACYRYIERNPVRAGLVDEAADYKWSSHAGNAGLRDDTLLDPHAEYLALSEQKDSRHRAYRQLFRESDAIGFLKEVRDATNGGYPLLGERMKAQVSAISDRPLRRKKPGPPPMDESGGKDGSSAELPL